MAVIYQITAETFATFQHQMLRGLSDIANGLLMMADDIDSGVIPERCAGAVVRDFSKIMSKMVAEISD